MGLASASGGSGRVGDASVRSCDGRESVRAGLAFTPSWSGGLRNGFQRLDTTGTICILPRGLSDECSGTSSSFRGRPASGSPAVSVARRLRRERRPQQTLRCLVPTLPSWETLRDPTTISTLLFQLSAIPYVAALYYMWKSPGPFPRLVKLGFTYLLVFVGGTIITGVIAKQKYGALLANVDYLHGTAETLLCITNLFLIVGLQRAIDAKRREKS
ncbi:hypothetical protein CDCA_CDCA12G3529 [Cyanidium caldarium]|uniref:DUF3593 domain-containing protein n=1 Tax=Cyanidium caldarium TaxID=2771 RepID=A0AAV9IYX6_CYACA|nr:hypothetical protein CDCA_CDCA12G3529 [Cyanidium caldarium]